MAKRRLKKKWRNILFFIVFGTISIFAMDAFKMWDKVNEYLKEYVPVGIKNLYFEKPTLKIFDETSDTRTIAVSINNNHDAYPHSGLQDAFLCYELIAEGGITRILAMYKDQSTSKIGSVRSTRHYFLDYVLENDAIFVHFGQSPQALIDLASLDIDNINGMVDGGVFYRDTTLNRSYEHTAFTSMKRINSEIKSKKYKKTSKELLLKYSPIKVNYEDDSTYKDATNIRIKYSDYQTTSYKYDENANNYLMFMAGKKHNDLVTKKQYTVKNIITYKVKNVSAGSKGRQDLENIGSGTGYYLSNGKYIKIKWNKSKREEKTVYTTMDGKELVVNDGNTWIHIVPSSGSIKID